MLTRLLAVFALVLALDFSVNALLFERASSFALHDEEAVQLAERLVSAERLLEGAPLARRANLSRQMSTPTLQIEWSASATRPLAAIDLARLQAQLLQINPELARAGLRLHVAPVPLDNTIGGSLVLDDGSVVSFRSRAPTTWALSATNLLRLFIPTVLLAAVALFLVQASLRPLRQLVRASRRVGTPHARPLEERGPAEVQSLIRAFNAMQRRIDALLDTNVETMLAIGHDLRTPLARLRLRLDALDVAEEDRAALEHDLVEMSDLLVSLQDFVDADSPARPAERIDLVAMIQTLVDGAVDRGLDAEYAGPDTLVVRARPAGLRRALANLLDNALHYGGNARVSVAAEAGFAEVEVADDGPGIPPESLDKVLQPFVRLDTARGRDTPGMGLGLAIVDRAVRTEGGTLRLVNRPEGGFSAKVRLALERG